MDRLQSASLIATQLKNGHQAGSWNPTEQGWSKKGGRLYCTALGALILEAYYRHRSVYDAADSDRDFPL